MRLFRAFCLMTGRFLILSQPTSPPGSANRSFEPMARRTGLVSGAAGRGQQRERRAGAERRGAATLRDRLGVFGNVVYRFVTF
jgi:hypothetical protein